MALILGEKATSQELFHKRMHAQDSSPTTMVKVFLVPKNISV